MDGVTLMDDATRTGGNAARRAAGAVAAAGGCNKLPPASSIGCGFAAHASRMAGV